MAGAGGVLVVPAPGSVGLSVGSGGNGFYDNPCANNPNQPFSPVEAGMGTGNTFSNICYSSTNVTGLPLSDCKG